MKGMVIGKITNGVFKGQHFSININGDENKVSNGRDVSVKINDKEVNNSITKITIRMKPNYAIIAEMEFIK